MGPRPLQSLQGNLEIATPVQKSAQSTEITTAFQDNIRTA